ncbi:hypothetical protein DPMN_117941 [Dreissena polymorpha]|uniref:Uncharacterized protein n=1 Tax=Dreissena polymorpha TaxID=45954 RepID=A0A9D4JLE9_DREPO|nr:hypothetical protein DPMN_117941 [Dreissena polymorpha]
MTEKIKYQLILSSLHVAPSGLVEAGELHIETDEALVEEGGVINLSERAEMKIGDGRVLMILLVHFF